MQTCCQCMGMSTLLLLLEGGVKVARVWIANSQRHPSGRYRENVTRPSWTEMAALILSITAGKHNSSANICNQPRLKYLFSYQGISTRLSWQPCKSWLTWLTWTIGALLQSCRKMPVQRPLYPRPQITMQQLVKVFVKDDLGPCACRVPSSEAKFSGRLCMGLFMLEQTRRALNAPHGSFCSPSEAFPAFQAVASR